MDNRYEIAEQNGMSREFADWFFDNKKAGCGDVWFVMMAAMWEGWQGRAAMLQGADGNIGKPLTIKLPDISSKAFWSGTGKNETFHPETYRRWVKEAIETSCTIARVDVEVK